LFNLFLENKISKKLFFKGDSDDEDNYTDNDENSSTKYTRADSLSHSISRLSQHSAQSNNAFLTPHQPFKNSHPTPRTTVTYNALKSRRNVIKMLFIVVLIYFISFSPQVLVFVLFDTTAIRNVPKFIQTAYFMAFTMLLVTLSSASNPIVYAIFCSKFRQSFLKILRKVFCCNQKELNYHSNQRALSLQQMPTPTHRFYGRSSNDDRRHMNSNENH
jgi:hypothetical protein